MKTDDLISQLSSDLKPVKPWPSPWKMALRYFIYGLVLVAALLVLTGHRYDLTSELTERHFWMGLLIWAIFFGVGLQLIFTLAVPGRKVSKMISGICSLIALAILAWHIHGVMGMTEEGWSLGADTGGILCSIVTLIAAGLSGFLIVRQLRRGASPRPLLSSAGVGIASLAVGGLLISLSCGNTNGAHVLIWHFLVPLVIVGGFAAFLIRKLLNW